MQGFFFRLPVGSVLLIARFRLDVHESVDSLERNQFGLEFSLDDGEPNNGAGECWQVHHKQTHCGWVPFSPEHAEPQTRHTHHKTHIGQQIGKPVLKPCSG